MKPKLNSQQAAEILAQLVHDPFDGPNWADLVQEHIPIQWDWPGWLSPGFLTILAGQPGTGKSSLCLHLATCYSHGRPWPDGAPFTANPGKTLWVESQQFSI